MNLVRVFGTSFLVCAALGAPAAFPCAHAQTPATESPAPQTPPESTPPSETPALPATPAADSPITRRAAQLAARRWPALTQRDARIAFSPRSAEDARAFLVRPELTPEQRAAAWIALGSSGAVRERVALEALALRGEGVERQAAILALGELATSTDALFTSLLGEPPEIAECALLALLRSGRASARRRVEEIAHDEAHALHEPARSLLVFVADPPASGAQDAATLLLELRWQAARRFGLVDGQTWHVLLVQGLARDEAFRRDLVLRGCARVFRPGVRDHVLQIALTTEDHVRLRAAVEVMPLDLQAVVENELWQPRDAAEWDVILTAIEDRGLERLCGPLVARAAEIDALHYRATVLVARAGTSELARYIDPDLSRLAVSDRVLACDAMAESGDAGWRPRLEDLEKSLDPTVRLAARVARMRLASRPAEDDLRVALDDPEHAEHAAVVAALVRVARDPYVGNLLEDYLPRAQESEELEIATALCREGRVTARARVRKALGEEPPPSGADALRLIRALARAPGPEDLEVFRALFPLENQRDANLELAAALLQLGDPAVLPIVRAAVWNSDLDLGVLASAVLAEIAGGLRALRNELKAPPANASSNDLRRVGFAIGEWGGLGAVDLLARELRYASGDPALQGALMGALAARTQ